MSTVLSPPPVRHGICRLTLRIGGTDYRLRPITTPPPGMKVWVLRALDGPRAGVTYSVATGRGSVGCTCPDHEHNGATCKHIMSLRALGIIPKGRRRDQQKPPVPALPGPVPSVKAKTRRQHVAALPDDGTSFAAGFRDAVRSHLAGMKAKGGAL